MIVGITVVKVREELVICAFAMHATVEQIWQEDMRRQSNSLEIFDTVQGESSSYRRITDSLQLDTFAQTVPCVLLAREIRAVPLGLYAS